MSHRKKGNSMKNVVLVLVMIFGMTLTGFGQDRDVIKERLQNAKSEIKSGVAVIKSAKDEARELREKVKNGLITKEEAKSRLTELKESVRSTKDEIKSNSAILRESRKELKELKRAKRP